MTKAMTKTHTPAPLPTADISEYEALALGAGELAELFAENFDSEGLDPFSLTNIKVPSGGAQQWEVEGLDGPEYSAAITGVIVGIQKTRKYWAQGLEDGGGGSPPDCQSADLETGVGTPGGLCEFCPFNEFGSDGPGKACKESWRVFLLQADSILPVVLNVPATSLRAVRKYQVQLTAKRLKYFSVVTRFTLDREKSQGGINYSRIKLEYAGRISPDHVQSVAEYVASFKPLINSQPIPATLPNSASENHAIMAKMRAGQDAASKARAAKMQAQAKTDTFYAEEAAAEILGGEVVTDPEYGVDMQTEIPPVSE